MMIPKGARRNERDTKTESEEKEKDEEVTEITNQGGEERKHPESDVCVLSLKLTSVSIWIQ